MERTTLKDRISGIPPVCKNIIIINVLIWLAEIVFQRKGIDLTNIFGLHYFQSPDFHIYQIFTYMFLHDTHSFTHIFFNMFAVFMFGCLIEQIWGGKRFLIYYLVCGIGAGLFNLLVMGIRIHFLSSGIPVEELHKLVQEGASILSRGMNYTDPILGKLNAIVNIPTIGASGAIFGILFAFAWMFPNLPLYIIPIPIPIKAKWMVCGYALVELFLGLRGSQTDDVAHFAHLGGLIFGFFLIYYWKLKNKKHGGDYTQIS